jgi:probable HAF family extracellular repeat protein
MEGPDVKPNMLHSLIAVGVALASVGLTASSVQAGRMYSVTSLKHAMGIPWAINASGQVVGMYSGEDGSARPFLYRDGQFIDMKDSRASGRDINDAGQVTHGNEISINNAGQVLVYDKWSFTSYVADPSGTVTSIPRDFMPHFINDLGQVAGMAGDGTGHPIAAIFANGVVTRVPRLSGAGDSAAWGINNQGQLVGGGYRTQSHPFMFDGSQLHDLGTLGGKSGDALGINNLGQIVGSAALSQAQDGFRSHAFLYENMKMLDLNDLIPAESGWVLLRAVAINDVGQVLGEGSHDGVLTSFLLTPTAVPEPTTLAMFGVGIVGYALRRVRKRR